MDVDPKDLVKESVDLGEAVKTKVYKSGKYWLVDVKHSKIDYTDWGPTGKGFANEKDAQEFAKHIQKSVKESAELGEVKIPNNYAAIMAKKRKASLVKDRKTGKMYDPDKEFEN
jgi:hypothetical protein